MRKREVDNGKKRVCKIGCVCVCVLLQSPDSVSVQKKEYFFLKILKKSVNRRRSRRRSSVRSGAIPKICMRFIYVHLCNNMIHFTFSDVLFLCSINKLEKNYVHSIADFGSIVFLMLFFFPGIIVKTSTMPQIK